MAYRAVHPVHGYELVDERPVEEQVRGISAAELGEVAAKVLPGEAHDVPPDEVARVLSTLTREQFAAIARGLLGNELRLEGLIAQLRPEQLLATVRTLTPDQADAADELLNLDDHHSHAACLVNQNIGDYARRRYRESWSEHDRQGRGRQAEQWAAAAAAAAQR
eukprot:TRINITY_DN10791_c0_g1_i1.p1 TRINITY_DN10791_c0_g1~~TRINITY_DN10791_c0_g1_i1.p1  ORF type:complete len:187 (+),score=62.33 TRINITY_DN10791_c0_g1_i1:70-561(+)